MHLFQMANLYILREFKLLQADQIGLDLPNLALWFMIVGSWNNWGVGIGVQIEYFAFYF